MDARPAPTADDIQPVANETRDRIITGTVTAVPFAALAVVGWQLWNDALRWSDLIVFAICYVATGLGVTVGFHRLFTHRAFKTNRWMRGGLAILGLLVPFGLGYLIGGTAHAAITALVWGGAVRMLVVHHVTYSINSLCHFFGRRAFATGDESRNLFWLAPFTFGESWHNNHHAFPTSFAHGMRRWQLDPSAGIIRLMEKSGLAWDVVRISPERQARKAI